MLQTSGDAEARPRPNVPADDGLLGWVLDLALAVGDDPPLNHLAELREGFADLDEEVDGTTLQHLQATLRRAIAIPTVRGCRRRRALRAWAAEVEDLLRAEAQDNWPRPPAGPVVQLGLGQAAPRGRRTSTRVAVIQCWHGTYAQPNTLTELVRVCDEARLRNPATWAQQLTAGEWRVGFRLELYPTGDDDWPRGGRVIGTWSDSDDVPDLDAPPVPGTVLVRVPGVGLVQAVLSPIQDPRATTYEVSLASRDKLVEALKAPPGGRT